MPIDDAFDNRAAAPDRRRGILNVPLFVPVPARHDHRASSSLLSMPASSVRATDERSSAEDRLDPRGAE
jgi:hypothetical protein